MNELSSIALLAGAGFVAGVVNAVAGGGTFFTFPALISVGLPPVVANASSALAVWPGHAAAVPASWGQLAAVRRGLPARCAVALAGGLVGAWLLLRTGDSIFAALVPWLLLIATALFALGPKLRDVIPRMRTDQVAAGLTPLGLGVEFVAAIYGGYFGAGLGVLLMACLALLGHDDMREANALKNLLASVVTSIAVVTFMAAGAIAWPQTLCVLAGAVVGGMIGAKVAQRIPAVWLRRAVLTIGTALTLTFMVRVYG